MFLYIVCSDFTDFIFHINYIYLYVKVCIVCIVLPLCKSVYQLKGLPCGNKTVVM